MQVTRLAHRLQKVRWPNVRKVGEARSHVRVGKLNWVAEAMNLEDFHNARFLGARDRHSDLFRYTLNSMPHVSTYGS